MGEVFAFGSSDKDLTSRIYKELKKINLGMVVLACKISAIRETEFWRV
jgi:hypothetical protein